MTLPHNLRPSLDVACSAVGDEIAALQARGERIVDVFGSSFNYEGCVMIATHTVQEHGVIIFGYTDEPQENFQPAGASDASSHE